MVLFSRVFHGSLNRVAVVVRVILFLLFLDVVLALGFSPACWFCFSRLVVARVSIRLSSSPSGTAVGVDQLNSPAPGRPSFHASTACPLARSSARPRGSKPRPFGVGGTSASRYRLILRVLRRPTRLGVFGVLAGASVSVVLGPAVSAPVISFSRSGADRRRSSTLTW